MGPAATYSFRVAGDGVTKSPAFGASVDARDAVTAAGDGADGRVIGGRDSYEFTGEVVAVSANGPVEFLLDGDPVTVADLVPDSRVVTVVGTGPPARYTLGATGSVAKSTAHGGSVQANDVVDGSRVAGRVIGGRDSYVVAGEVVSLETAGPVEVRVDGDQVDPATLDRLTHTVTFAGDGRRASYSFATSGTVLKSYADGGSIQANDAVGTDGVTGLVVGGRDSYAFDGDLRAVTVDPGVRVFVDGREVAVGADGSVGALGVGSMGGPGVAGLGSDLGPGSGLGPALALLLAPARRRSR